MKIRRTRPLTDPWHFFVGSFRCPSSVVHTEQKTAGSSGGPCAGAWGFQVMAAVRQAAILLRLRPGNVVNRGIPAEPGEDLPG